MAIESSCRLCGGKRFKKLFEVKGKNLVRCSRCGLVKTQNFVEPDYKQYHRDKEYLDFEPYFANFFKKRIMIAEKFITAPGRALEIGCSVGLLLSLLKKKGWEVWGVEPSKSADLARKQGIKVIKDTFERASLPLGYFDLVILNHTLEHLEDPLGVLKKARTLLRKEGKILVDVPNFGSLSSRLLGKNWPYLAPEEHVHHFESKTLKKLMKKAGFKVIHQESRSGIFDWGSPLGGLYDEIRLRPRSFVKDVLTFPGALLVTLLRRGTSLTTVGKRL